MTTRCYVAREQGLSIFARGRGKAWVEAEDALAGQAITTVISRQGVILAGSRQGVFRSEDGGRMWSPSNEGLTIPHVRWLDTHPQIPDCDLAGTEPAGIFVSRDGGTTWQERPEVGRLRDTNGWYLPYSPQAGCVRGFVQSGRRAYAAVEVGGVLRSDNGGRTWTMAPGSSGSPSLAGIPSHHIHPDVHSLCSLSDSADEVLAATGGGLYRTMDGGSSWQRLHPQYCRAVWADPQDHQHLVLGPARSVDRDGTLVVSFDGGRTWQPARGDQELLWPHAMVERFTVIEQELAAVLSNGVILVAPLDSLHWRRLWPAVKDARAIAVSEA